MLKILTNNIPRPTLMWEELTEEDHKKFDYPGAAEHDFVIYKGDVVDLGEFLTASIEDFNGWDGYSPDSAFSGLLVRYCEDHDWVVMGWYYGGGGG